jgi:hypothetical protein
MRSFIIVLLGGVLLAACQQPLGKAETAAAGFDASRSVGLITGSNRGIGLAFARYYAQAGWNDIATTRNPERANELQALAAANDSVIIEQLDVTDLERMTELGAIYATSPINFNSKTIPW